MDSKENKCLREISISLIKDYYNGKNSICWRSEDIDIENGIEKPFSDKPALLDISVIDCAFTESKTAIAVTVLYSCCNKIKSAEICFDKRNGKCEPVLGCILQNSNGSFQAGVPMSVSAPVTIFEYNPEKDSFVTYKNTNDTDFAQRNEIKNFLQHFPELNIIHPDDLQNAVNMLKFGDFTKNEVRCSTATDTGIYHWYKVLGSAIYENGHISRIIGVLRTIDSTKKREEENLILKEISNFAIENDYETIFLIDTLPGSFRVVKKKAKTDVIYPDYGDYTSLIKYYCEVSVYGNDRANFLSKFQLENLTAALKNNINNIEVYYRIFSGDKLKWHKANFIPLKNSPNKLLLIVRDIQNIKLAEQKEIMLRESIKTALQNIYSEIFEINLTRNKITYLDSKLLNEENFKSEYVYNELSEYVNTQLIHPEYRADFNATFSLDTMKEFFSDKDKTLNRTFEILTNDGSYAWHTITVVRIENTVDSDILLIGFMENIDKIKRAEEQQKKRSDQFYIIRKNNCENILEININTGFFKKIYENKKSAIKFPSEGVFEEQAKVFAEKYILENERQEYINHSKLENMLNILKSKDNEHIDEYSLIDNAGKLRYFQRNISILTESANTEYIFLYTRDITLYRSEQKKLAQQRLEFTYTLSAIYDEIIDVNITKDYFSLTKSDSEYEKLYNNGCFSEFFPRYIEKFIHPDDRGAISKTFSYDSILTAINNGTTNMYKEVRLLKNKAYLWVEAQMLVIPHCAKDDKRIILTIRNIDKIKKMEEKQHLSDIRLSIAMRNSYNAVFEANIQKNKLYSLQFQNETLHRREIKISYKMFLRKMLNTILHPDDKEKFEAGVKLADENPGHAEYFECRCINKSSEYIWYSFYIQKPQNDKKNQIIMLFIKNISSVKSEEEKNKKMLKDALISAESANKSKSDFLSRMSHDMRTPMNAIMGMTTIAEDYIEDKEKIRDCLNKINTSAKYLLSLINDILDMAKIENGKIVLNKDKFNFNNFIDKTYTLIRMQADEKNIQFNLQYGETSEYYIGDELRLNQILINILSNAVKFTPPNGRIDFIIEETGRQNGIAELKFIIKDNGVGMSPEFKKRIFMPFEQENSKAISNYSGSGLGLAITHNLVKIMNGRIKVKSELDKGSEFVVTIKLSVTEAEKLENKAFNTYSTNIFFNQEKILLVEDNELNLEIAKTILESRNLIIITAKHGEEALSIFKASPEGYFSAILMDIRMPIMNGLDASAAIRALERSDAAKIPIIAMSANAFKEDIKNAKKHGINDYITKPIDIPKLYNILINYINN